MPLIIPRLILLVGAFTAGVLIAGTGDLTWYPFPRAFIEASYQNGVPVADFTFSGWGKSGIHPSSCGGKDGEIHIGALVGGLSPLPSVNDDDESWGIVAELPNAIGGKGAATLKTLDKKSIHFRGYLRLWDEGHAKGQVHPSNPHHVFEVHPAWRVEGPGATFDKVSLVKAIPEFHGYGATKFKPLFDSVKDGTWPRAYLDGDHLYVLLRESANFHQLPVIVQDVRDVDGGHEALVDVYSDESFKTLRYEGLRCYTPTGSDYDLKWKKAAKTYLLGFFSVNLGEALKQVGAAGSEDDAAHVPEALEFFVFGRPLLKADATCP
jgi:hypothetical protein